MVGDSLEDDVEGARALGMRAYLVDRDGRAEVEDALPTLLALPALIGVNGRCLTAGPSTSLPRAVEESLETPVRGLMWSLGLGAFGLAWSITTVAAYLPPVLGEFTDSATLIGLVLAAEGIFAFFMPLFVGPMSDATHLPLGRRRPFMAPRARAPWRSVSRCSPSCRPSRRRRSRSSASSSPTTSTSRPTAASTRTCVPDDVLRPRPGRPARSPRDRARRGARRRRLPALCLGAVPLHPRGRGHPRLLRRGGRARPRDGRRADALRALPLHPRGALAHRRAGRSTCAAS